MTSGSTPTVALASKRARTGSPSFSAVFLDARRAKAAPSAIPLELPAETEPVFLKTGGSLASFSAVMPSRGHSSFSFSSSSPAKRPSLRAVSQRRCDSAAKASCSSRGITSLSASVSAVAPMTFFAMGQRKPSLYMASTTSASPRP